MVRIAEASLHEHLPSSHAPRPEQLTGQGTAISQPSPSYPARHAHVPEGRHRPQDEQSSGHCVFWLQLSPLQPAAQMHTPLAVAQLPWPEQLSPSLPSGHSKKAVS